MDRTKKCYFCDAEATRKKDGIPVCEGCLKSEFKERGAQ